MWVFLLTGAVLLGLVAALVRLPHWSVRSICRHMLWQLRDRLVDDVLDGQLPRHPAVLATIADIEADVHTSTRIGVVDLLILRRILRSASPAAVQMIRQAAQRPDPYELSIDQLTLLKKYWDQQAIIVTDAVIMGSWMGMAALAGFVPLAVSKGWRQAWRRAVTAVEKTRYGQSATETVRERRLIGSVCP